MWESSPVLHGSVSPGPLSAPPLERRAPANPAHAPSAPAAPEAVLLPCVFTSFTLELYPGRCFPYCLRQPTSDCANSGSFVASGAG